MELFGKNKYCCEAELKLLEQIAQIEQSVLAVAKKNLEVTQKILIELTSQSRKAVGLRFVLGIAKNQ